MRSARHYYRYAAHVLAVALIPVLQPQTVAARRHHDDESSGDESSGDESSGDESSGRSNDDQSSGDQSSGPSLPDKICHALNNGAGPALIPLLHAAGIASGGTVTAAVAAAELYCSSR
jgi:hypothetical protein